eukprot:COSAG01_NODE_16885_length_1196_cov_2.212397_2_plen_35_part_01
MSIFQYVREHLSCVVADSIGVGVGAGAGAGAGARA